MKLKEGIRIRFGGIGPRSLTNRGTLVKVYKKFMLVDAGKYMITVSRADVIDKGTVVEAKIDKKWVQVTAEVFEDE